MEEYHKLAGLVNFACCALSLPASAMSIFWEPMRKGFEKDEGSPSTTLIRVYCKETDALADLVFQTSAGSRSNS